MLGVKGKLGLVSYQAGLFATHGEFIPNYFGGRYEDLKWDSWTNSGKQGLPIITSYANDSRNGLISRFWVEVNPWLNLGYLNIADVQNTTGLSLSGNIERLGVDGFYYYNQLRDVVILIGLFAAAMDSWVMSIITTAIGIGTAIMNLS